MAPHPLILTRLLKIFLDHFSFQFPQTVKIFTREEMSRWDQNVFHISFQPHGNFFRVQDDARRNKRVNEPSKKKTTTDNDDEFIPNDENSIWFSSLHPLYASSSLLTSDRHAHMNENIERRRDHS